MATGIEQSVNHHSTGLKDEIQAFLDDNDQVEHLVEKTEFLSTSENLVQTIQELTSEELTRLVEKLDEVCHSTRLLMILPRRLPSA